MKAEANKKADERLEIGVLYGFRALMVLFVVNYHLWQQGWLPQRFVLFDMNINLDFFTRSSYLFVDGMMLLSGFLLFLPYARQRRENIQIPSVRRFYLNRLVRILPSYLLCILVILFCFVLPQSRQHSAQSLGFDLITHLTFTYTFFPQTYLNTLLNTALWTVAVELQFYLIFPWLARAAQKKPVLTLLMMAMAGWIYRGIVYYAVPDTSIFINQMPAFLDVYALGMLGAIIYCLIRERLQETDRKQLRLYHVISLLLFAASVIVVLMLLRAQSTASMHGHEELRLSQLRMRLPLALTLLVSMLSAAYMPRALQWLLSNRLMRFLAGISFNLYVWHQFLAVEIAKGWFPNTLHYNFNLQLAYTVLCFSLSLVVAMAATYGIEKPMAKCLNNMISKYGGKNKHERSSSGQIEPPTDSVLLQSEKG